MPGFPVVELLQIVQIAGITTGIIATVVGGGISVSKLLFVTKDEAKSHAETLKDISKAAYSGMAAIQRETSESLAQMRLDHLAAINAAKEEARANLSKAVEERRKDVSTIDALIRNDLNEKFQAGISRMTEAIKESKEERKTENEKIWDALDGVRNLLMKPRIPDTTAVHRDQVR